MKIYPKLEVDYFKIVENLDILLREITDKKYDYIDENITRKANDLLEDISSFLRHYG